MEFTRGDTYKFRFQRKDASKHIIKTVANEVWFTVKENYETDEILFQKTLTKEDITFDEDFYYHIVIKPEDTKDLQYNTDYVCDIQVLKGEDIKTIYKDTLKVTEEVTFDYEIQPSENEEETPSEETPSGEGE